MYDGKKTLQSTMGIFLKTVIPPQEKPQRLGAVAHLLRRQRSGRLESEGTPNKKLARPHIRTRN
jgi:hypothetical protein